MGYMDVGVVILAAGKGTRMKSDTAKVLHKVGGQSMVNHVVDCARKISRDSVTVVVGHQALDVKKEVRQHFQVKFALQKQLLGTGDAVKTAIPGLKQNIKDVVVLCGDVPLIQENTLKQLVNEHKEKQASVSVLATDVENPQGYGRIIRDDAGNMICIREEADASDVEKKINKINTGIYCFDKNFLMAAVEEIRPENNQAEYYLTDVVEIARKRNKKIVSITMDDPGQVMGVNTLEELEKAEYLIQVRTR